jgi:hypothetical protein
MFRSTPDIEKLACEAMEKITEKQAAEQPVANHGSSGNRVLLFHPQRIEAFLHN